MDIKSLLFSFTGRINRLPFWVVMLVLTGWGSTFQILMGPFGPENPMTIGPGLLTIANLIIVLWIWLAVEIKRWHDLNKSGWWVLINLVPVIGQIWVFIACGCFKGTAGTNRYGTEPKAAAR